MIGHRIILELLAGLAIVAAAALGFSSWQAERGAKMRAEATVATQQSALKDLQGRIAALQQADAARQQQLEQSLRQMKTEAAKAQTTPEILRWLAQQVKVPVPVPVPQGSAPVEVPQPDLPSVRDFVEVCKECDVELPVAKAQVQSLQAQLKIAGQQLSAQENETAAWKKAARGTFWSRAKRTLKGVAIGGMLGGAVLCGTGHCK